MKKLVPTLLIIHSLTCFAFLSKSQAVSPPPDGGYAGGNTAEGQSALFSLTTGTYNTALGLYSLLSDSTGTFNTGVGAGTLLVNTGDSNTATGAGALLNNTTGGANTATGVALFQNNTGSGNTATGDQALQRNTVGGGNTANGNLALWTNDCGNNNTAIGVFALAYNPCGSGNTALGASAGNQVTGDNNIDIGNPGEFGESNTIRIGDPFVGQFTTYIAGIIGTAVTGTPVVVTDTGQLGVAVSSSRFKEEITAMDKASEAILALRPVSFCYKKEIDPERTPQFGLVAEQVEKVNPDLIVRDKEGKPFSVRYDAVNAMLLNEHRKVEEQQTEIDSLKAELKEQRDLIQKVSEQIEMGRTVRRVVAIDQ